MRANSKVAILVVSMFVLAALAPAVTVLCGSDDASADTITGVSSAKATIFTENSEDYNSLVYLSEKFPTEASDLNIANWRYDETKGYWVYINKNSERQGGQVAESEYGDVLTYSMISGMSLTDIKQDIVDKYYRDDIVNLKGDKYEVSGGSIVIGTKSLTYSKVGDDITIQTSGVTIVAALDVLGRSVFPLTPITYDHLTIDYDGNITVYDGSTPVIESAYQIVVNDGVTNYYLVRNVDASNAKFQLIQVGFEVKNPTDVTVRITKTGADETYSVNADMTFADCYFDKRLQYALIKTIDTKSADITPTSIEGTYEANVRDSYGFNVTVNSVLGGIGCVVYGTVMDADGSVTGSVVTNPLYDAVVSYSGTTPSGEQFTGSVTVSSVTDETGNVQGFYRIEVEKGTSLQITNVACVGYSFTDQTGDYGVVNGDIDPVDSPNLLKFKANEHTITVTVKDKAGNVAPKSYVQAEWWYQYGSGETDYCSTTYPEAATAAGGKSGVAALPTSYTDSEGKVKITYTAPTLVNYVLLVRGINNPNLTTSTYTFEVDDTTSWKLTKTLPTATKAGNVIVLTNGSGSTATNITAREYSFTVTAESNNGRALEGASLNATWYYRGTNDGDVNKVTVPDSFKPLSSTEHEGTVTVISSSGSDGVIRVVYLPAVLDPLHWQALSSAFIYIYGTGYNFSYVSDVDKLTTDPVTSGYPGAILLKYYEHDDAGTQPAENKFIDTLMSSKKVKSDDNLWTVSGSITSHSGELPVSVRTIVTVSSKSTEYTFYRSGSTFTYSFNIVDGSVPTIDMVSSGYVFTCTSPSIGKIIMDRTVDYLSDYVGTSSFYREEAKEIGITTGYIVNGIASGTVINYTYTVGNKDCSTLVKATSSSVSYVVKGKDGMAVTMSASETTGNYYIGEFNSSGIAEAVKLKETNNVLYKGSIDNVLKGKSDDEQYRIGITVLYKGEVFTEFVTSPETGTATAKVPESDVTYAYGKYPIAPTAISSGKYAGYLAFDMDGYVDPGVGDYVTVTIEYYATSSIENLSSATCKPIVYVDDTNPTKATIKVGDSKTFTAPDLVGFKFAGWYLDGTYYSDAKTITVCDFTALADVDGGMGSDVTLRAYYSAESVTEADKGIDSTVLVIGLVAIVIAVLALVYVVFQTKRY